MTKFRRRTELPQIITERVPPEELKPPTLAHIQSLARAKTEAALNVLAAIMYRETTNAFARVAAANAILDRGWGKAVQPLANEAGPFETLHRIERVIVHPDQPPVITNRVEEAMSLELPQDIAPREAISR